MPIFLEPDQSFPVWLESDKDKHEESRPTFFVRSQSMRNQRKVLEVLDNLHKPGVTVDEVFSETVEQLKKVLAGWSNMNGIAFTPEAIEDVFTFTEARELLRLVAYNQRMDTTEKKG
jgi:hypothetical protein